MCPGFCEGPITIRETFLLVNDPLQESSQSEMWEASLSDACIATVGGSGQGLLSRKHGS